jgi:beta-phosphoglucomutase-like phosphatase (HAD superfamily)
MGKFSGADLKQSKPHPEIFIKAAEHTGCEKDECIVIEDSTNGIKAANNAGIYCVGFKSKHSTNQDYSLADTLISNYNEIDYKKINELIN